PPQPFPVKYRIVLVAAALVLAVYLLWPTRLNSLVVLPFRDTSPNAEPSFAAGLTDAVLTNLAKIERLKVVYYPDISRKAPAGIAAALRVEAALEGSVLYVGDRVKITVRMSRATTG